MSRRGGGRFPALGLMLAPVWLLAVAPGLPEPEPEYALKAKIFVGILPYIQWASQPAWGEAPFQIAVLGRSPFGPHLDRAAAGQTAHRRPIRVRYILKVAEAEGCQALFICSSESARAETLLGWAAGRGMLTVTDDPQVARRGAMVNLLLEGERVKLSVNPESAQASGIFLGSHLMRYARPGPPRSRPS